MRQRRIMFAEAIAIVALLIILIATSSCQGSQITSLAAEVDNLQTQLTSNQAGAGATGGASTTTDTTNSSPSNSSGATTDDAKSQTTQNNGQTGVESKWTSTGWFTTGDQRLDETIKEYADAHSKSDNAYDNAYNTYLNETWIEYVERDDNQNPSGEHWPIEYAQSLFDEMNGNCYNYAAAIALTMRYFGFDDATPLPAIVKLQSGDWGDHGLVRLTYEGQEKLLDAARSSNGWMLDGDSYTYTVKDV